VTAGNSEVALDEALPDIDWAIQPQGAERGWVDAPSGRLATLAMGEPGHPRVLLVPGVTGSKEDFALMLPLLAAAGYRAESFDMAGQYESATAGPPRRTAYDHDLFVRDLVFMLGESPAHVLGYSFAGTVAQLALVERPDLFLSLTLLSTPPQPGQGFRGIKRLGPFTGLATGRIGAALMIWGVWANVTRVPPKRLEFVRHRFSLTRRSSVADIIGLMKRVPDLRTRVAAADIPKLVAVGEHDLWPLRLHAALAEAIGARLAIYRTGHSPCETAPHQLVRDMLALYRA
jgi:pimeloyl-ACP methyl ester carboxylesterase